MYVLLLSDEDILWKTDIFKCLYRKSKNVSIEFCPYFDELVENTYTFHMLLS